MKTRTKAYDVKYDYKLSESMNAQYVKQQIAKRGLKQNSYQLPRKYTKNKPRKIRQALQIDY